MRSDQAELCPESEGTPWAEPEPTPELEPAPEPFAAQEAPFEPEMTAAPIVEEALPTAVNSQITDEAFPTSVNPQITDDAVAAAAPPPSTSGELTDDQIDRIARRVVQLMSEQVVRNIAWEVIPDLAEMVVKKRIRQLESEA